MTYKLDTFKSPEKGVYYHPIYHDLKEPADLNLFYHSIKHELSIQYTVKTITMTSPPWPHNQPLHDTPVQCDHPRTWNKHSKETIAIQRITSEKGYELGYEEHIRPAITGILDKMRQARQELLKQELLQAEDKARHEANLIVIMDWVPCPECTCQDKCYQHGLCGTGCTNPQMRCDNNKEGGDLI